MACGGTFFPSLYRRKRRNARRNTFAPNTAKAQMTLWCWWRAIWEGRVDGLQRRNRATVPLGGAGLSRRRRRSGAAERVRIGPESDRRRPRDTPDAGDSPAVLTDRHARNGWRARER